MRLAANTSHRQSYLAFIPKHFYTHVKKLILHIGTKGISNTFSSLML